MHFKSQHLRRLLLVLDVLLCALVYLLVLQVWVAWTGANYKAHLANLSVLPIVVLALAWAELRFDRPRQGLPWVWGQLRLVGLAVAFAVAGATLFQFVFQVDRISRLVLGVFAVSALVTLAGARLFLLWYYFHGRVERRENYLKVLVVGTGNRARGMRARLEGGSEFGVDVVGYLDPEPTWVDHRALDAPLLGDVASIGEVLRDQVIDEVVVALPRSRLGDLQAIVDACEEEGVRLKFMADIYDLDVKRVSLEEVQGVPMLAFEPVAQDEGKLMVKRLFDLTATLLAMPLLVPLLAVVALAIRLESPGPVFFVQQRVGLNKRRFGMIKFRSMYQDAEARLKDIEHLNEAEGPIFKMKDDPRVTRVGAFIRKTSIDELPQLFNVIIGQMSLVGPRPMSIRDVELFDRGIQRKRFSVRPGLTCIWQVSGRSDLPFEKWLELDLEYIDRWSLTLDLSILIRTVPAVFRGAGAV